MGHLCGDLGRLDRAPRIKLSRYRALVDVRPVPARPLLKDIDMTTSLPLAALSTDASNADALVERHGENIRYVAQDKMWLVWDGSRWEPDALGKVHELAKDTIRAYFATAAEMTDDNLRATLSKHAAASLSANRLAAMVKLATTDPAVAISAAALDTDLWALNCSNGTVDLRTGELRPANRGDLITKTTGVEYDPKAKCPQWDAFISWAMCERPELVTFLQRAVGMSITGDASERLVIFLHGAGANGKSVTLKVILSVVGEYGHRMRSDTLEAATFAKGGGGASDDIASLKGARFVCTSEIEDGTKLATALLKDLTGDEKLRARHLYRSSFEFTPEFTPWIAANHKPLVPSDDQAVWDRMRLVPYDARISDSDKDTSLGDKLRNEAPGILAWAVRGALEWQRDGITEPDAVMEATASYRASMDTFGDFLDHITEAPYIVFTPSALRETYNTWAKTNDLPKMGQREFSAHMTARGWTLGRSNAARTWTAPAVKVVRVNWADQARLAAEHEPTVAEIAAYLEECRAVA